MAASQPPIVRKGDLRHDLSALAAEAPPDATLVIFHTAVLSYLALQDQRDSFSESVRQIADHWISNEWACVFPRLAPECQTTDMSRFLIMLDGKAMAWSDPHGRLLTCA